MMWVIYRLVVTRSEGVVGQQGYSVYTMVKLYLFISQPSLTIGRTNTTSPIPALPFPSHQTLSPTKYIYIKSTTEYVPRRNWDSPKHSLASESVPLPPEPWGGGAHSPTGEGLGESQFRRL